MDTAILKTLGFHATKRSPDPQTYWQHKALGSALLQFDSDSDPTSIIYAVVEFAHRQGFSDAQSEIRKILGIKG